jgi:hypothetical protein
MLYWIVLYWVVSFLTIIILGFVQTSNEENRPFYSYSAIGLIIVQAVVSVAVYAGTSMFPIAAVVLGITLVCHHAIIHRNSAFEGEMCSCSCFQLKDISNHETWVVACVVAAVISSLHI